MPVGANTFGDGLRMGTEIFHHLKSVLKTKGYHFSRRRRWTAPNLGSNDEALDVILTAIENAGYRPNEDVLLSLDAASRNYMKMASIPSIGPVERTEFWRNGIFLFRFM